jgi:hypothetical protein
MGRPFGIEGKWGTLGIMVTPVPEREGGRLQEGDDRWAPPIIGGKKRGGNGSVLNMMGLGPLCLLGWNGSPRPFSIFILFTPFLFLFF